MHTQKEALVILGCDKSTLSRYVADEKLLRVKKGRNTYYDEHEVAALVKTIELNKAKVGIEIKEKEQIPLEKELVSVVKNVDHDNSLDKIGFQYLADATSSLKELGLYHDCDKQILVLYAINAQMYFRYLFASSSVDHLTENAGGNVTIHPHFKVMQHHEKQMLAYMDRLGLNPLSRNKFEIQKPKEVDAMDRLING